MYINELLFYKIVIGLVFVLFLLIYLVPKLNVRTSKSTFQVFESSKEVFSYFKYSFKFIFRNKYILLLPMSFSIIDNMNLFYIFSASKLASVSNIYYYGSLIRSIYHLDLGYYDFVNFYGLNISVVILVIAIIYLLIKSYLDVKNGRNIAFILTAFVLFIYNLKHISLFYDINSLNTISSVSFSISSIYILPILNIILKSYLETFLLLYFTFSLRNSSIDLKVLINNVTKNVKYLIFANLLISTPDLLNSVVLRYMKINNIVQEFEVLFNTIYNSYLQPLSFLLQITLFLVPIIIVYNRLNLINSVKLNIWFIHKHFIKFITFILFGIGLNILFYSFYILVKQIAGFDGLFEIFSVINLFLMVIFYIAFFKFYIDTQKQSDQNVIV